MNYIDLGKSLLGGWEHYVYLDTDEFLARSLFNRHGIHVKLDGVMERENELYRLVALRVLKKDEELFLRAMEELKGKMLLFGHRDYDARGSRLIEITRELIRKEAAATGRVRLPAGGTIRAEALPEL